MSSIPFINSYIHTNINYNNNRVYTTISLDLSHKFISDLEAKHIADNLKNNSMVTYINLMGNNITDEGAVAISIALIYNTTLRKICLQENNISYRGKIALIAAKEKHTNLEILF